MYLHVHCTAFYSPATEALINNNNNNSLNASVQTSVDDVSRVDKKVRCHSKVCGIDAA